ncbi:hypothetical protein [uncultured Celeribacter sp.]|uniref:hypothetical protein n=1 Tax=uncultured Celeribacter sp. TaxID=1303376 RepID=UPI002AA915E9|nr:hypothetical protein [uncultured Celeribacter sp.]
MIKTVNCEIFTTPNLGEQEIHLDVGRMRVWVEQHVELQKIRIDPQHVKRLVDGGTVTEERVMSHTISQPPKPILVCEHPDGTGDEIVDGNHTYVATALSWAEAMEQGLVSPSDTPFVLGYGLTHSQWQSFIVPASQLRKQE